MRADIRGRVGPQFLSDGVQQRIRTGKGGELVVGRLHGNYTEQAYRGNVFVGTTSNSVTLQQLNNSGPAMCLLNPQRSDKYLALIRFEMCIAAIPVTPVAGLYALQLYQHYATDPTTTLDTNVYPAITAANAIPNGKIFRGPAFTGATGTLYRMLASHYTGAATVIPNIAAFFIDFDGTCLLSPGNSIAPCQTNNDSTNASVHVSFVWEEIPI